MFILVYTGNSFGHIITITTTDSRVLQLTTHIKEYILFEQTCHVFPERIRSRVSYG